MESVLSIKGSRFAPRTDEETAHMRAAVLGAARSLADTVGYDVITRALVAEMAGCSTGHVNTLFGTMDALKAELLRGYIEVQDLKQIARALTCQDPAVRDLDSDLKRRAALTLAQ